MGAVCNIRQNVRECSANENAPPPAIPRQSVAGSIHPRPLAHRCFSHCFKKKMRRGRRSLCSACSCVVGDTRSEGQNALTARPLDAVALMQEPRVFFASVDVLPWRGDPVLTDLDREMRDAGAHCLPDLAWTQYAYLEDGEHFTREAYAQFMKDLSTVLRRTVHTRATMRTLLLTDSTIAHHESNASAARRLRIGCGLVVDAVCGSGHAARSREGLCFGDRVRRHLRKTSRKWDAVVVLGGWNDRGHRNASHAVRGTLRSLRCRRVRRPNTALPNGME